MEVNCPTTNAGTEWDWLNFFFNLWQDDTAGVDTRLEMYEITNIWDDTYARNAKPYWDEIDQSAKDIFIEGSAKYGNFDDKADKAGVQH